jgi:Holliday junction resolvase RusA-like endonuclease
MKTSIAATSKSEWIWTGLKPLSANEAFAPRAVKRGRFFRGEIYKTSNYRKYEAYLLKTLPNIQIPEGKIQLRVKVLYSSAASDIDNCLKPFIDVLQKRYSFNDNRIYKIQIIKELCKKGEEGIWFNLSEYTSPSLDLVGRTNATIRKALSQVWGYLRKNDH